MSASSCMTKRIQTQGFSSSLRMEEETMLMKKQGIGTILGSHCHTNTASASSLRRTLSADMSSKKWFSQNMKKIGSSEELLHSPKTVADSLSSSSEGEDEAEAERERLEIWSSIQRNKKEEQEKAGGAFDMWSSLMSLKENNEISKSLPVTPYIHPLVKRSKSCLSEKSLEICTESLGSETGSDGLFSSYPSSETGDAEEDKEEEQHQLLLQQQQQQAQEKMTEAEKEEEFQVPRYNYAAAATKKSPPRSFPPPLPSLTSRQPSGSSLHMRSHRDNGRLVLEAVSIPSQNSFCVQRQDGRLVLTFANHEEPQEDADDVVENDGVEELEEEFEEIDDDDDEDEKEHEEDEDQSDKSEEEEEEEVGETEGDVRDVERVTVMEKAPLLSNGITTTTTTLMMNKPIGLVNRNPQWTDKFNEVEVNVVKVEQSPGPQSLPPRPRVARLIPSTPSAAAASFNFNAYEYYWRTEPTTKAATLEKHNNKLIVSGDLKQNSNDQQQLLVLRGKNGDYLVRNLESCKDSRRSFLFWEPYCIATS